MKTRTVFLYFIPHSSSLIPSLTRMLSDLWHLAFASGNLMAPTRNDYQPVSV